MPRDYDPHYSPWTLVLVWGLCVIVMAICLSDLIWDWIP